MERDRLDDIAALTMERNRSVATKDEPDNVLSDRLSGAAVKRPEITDSLGKTFLDEWARVGYSALSLETVARKAGVGKAALYRRWRSKADMARDLVLQAIKTVPARLESGDCGSLEADLDAMLMVGRLLLRHRLIRRILPDLYSALDREPALVAALRPGDALREKKVRTLIDRAVARGEVSADVDRRLVTDFAIGPLYWRMVVLGERYSREQVREIARMTAAAIRKG